jgi:hypothetical protein
MTMRMMAARLAFLGVVATILFPELCGVVLAVLAAHTPFYVAWRRGLAAI